MIPVERNFLELRDIKKLKFNSFKENKFLIKKIKPDFQLNKFFYKQVGKKENNVTLLFIKCCGLIIMYGFPLVWDATLVLLVQRTLRIIFFAQKLVLKVKPVSSCS